ncbi:MAG: hypothetical protein JW791_01500 [Nanoarchaeota archaeon]|nr:hypothetical protein [Nanoarchaeota archaeon]
MSEQEALELKKYVRANLEVFLLLKQSNSANDVFIDTKKFSKQISYKLEVLTHEIIEDSNDYDSLMNYYLDKCSKNIEDKIRSGFEKQREGVMMVEDIDLGKEAIFSMVTGNYLNLLGSNSISKLGFSDNYVIGYFNLWNFCNIKNNRFKSFLVTKIYKRIKELKKENPDNQVFNNLNKKKLALLFN